jgi:hypothetical protein
MAVLLALEMTQTLAVTGRHGVAVLVEAGGWVAVLLTLEMRHLSSLASLL